MNDQELYYRASNIARRAVWDEEKRLRRKMLKDGSDPDTLRLLSMLDHIALQIPTVANPADSLPAIEGMQLHRRFVGLSLIVPMESSDTLFEWMKTHQYHTTRSGPLIIEYKAIVERAHIVMEQDLVHYEIDKVLAIRREERKAKKKK